MADPNSSARITAMVAAGVSLGALVRWAISAVDIALWATLVANIAGCLIAGIAARCQPAYRAFWVTGVAGGMSTLSAVGIDVRAEWSSGRPAVAVVYIAITLAAGMIAVVIGRGDAVAGAGAQVRS